jgi:hypothetical protein
MTDHESEIPQMDEAPRSEATASNEIEPGGEAASAEPEGMTPAEEPSFLADLAKAMQSTAAVERARDAEATEQRRQMYVDGIRAREATEADELRELAKDDVTAIDAWSDGEIRRIKLERERRIATRREQLQLRLEEHRSVVGREVTAVEAAISAYQREVDVFFLGLESETDPVEIARQAGTRPLFPILELIGPEDAPEGSVIDPDERTHEGDDGPVSGAGLDSTPDRLVGVMDAGSASVSNDGGVESSVQAPDEQPDEASVEEPVGVAVGASTEPDAPQNTDDSPNLSETRGVTPRTGAGSWLRWPNSSPDHSDSNH